MSIQRSVSNAFAALLFALAAACIPPIQQPGSPAPPASASSSASDESFDSDSDGEDGDGDGDDDDDDDGGDDDGDDDDGGNGDSRETIARPREERNHGSKSGSGEWSCNAQGSYQTCSSAGLCTTWPVTGMGVGSSESQARILAETNCSGHMSNLMATANLGDSSASVQVSCAASSCSP